jgi:hypothetical protein
MSHISCSQECGRMWGNEPRTPKWTPTLGVEILTNFQISRKLRGQNPWDWGVPYIIGKILKFRCLKWACITDLDISNTSYGQKKGRESNWYFDSQPLKVKIFPNFLTCKWHATYRWKALDKGYNFDSDLISIEGFHTKLWALKVVGDPTLGIWGLPFGSPETKWHLGVGIIYTIRGEVMASPKSGPWWVLWIRRCSWFVRAPKCSNYSLTKSLFGLCRFVWVIKLLVNLPSPHPEALTRPSTPKVQRTREPAPTPFPFVVLTFGQLNPSKNFGVRHMK